jgi:hypothetical protein
VTNSVLEGWRVGDESYFRICLSIADWALWKMEDTMKLLALLGTFQLIVNQISQMNRVIFVS